jgi:hypothetical protein
VLLGVMVPLVVLLLVPFTGLVVLVVELVVALAGLVVLVVELVVPFVGLVVLVVELLVPLVGLVVLVVELLVPLAGLVVFVVEFVVPLAGLVVLVVLFVVPLAGLVVLVVELVVPFAGLVVLVVLLVVPFAGLVVLVVLFVVALAGLVVLVVLFVVMLRALTLRLWGRHWHLFWGINLSTCLTLLQSLQMQEIWEALFAAGLHWQFWFWGTAGWVQLHTRDSTLVTGLVTIAQQHWEASSKSMFLLTKIAVAFNLWVQSQVEMALPSTMVSLQVQLRAPLLGAESLWHRVGGGLGTQQVQLSELTPPRFWFKHEHWLSALRGTLFLVSSTNPLRLVQSQTWEVVFVDELKMLLQLHCWVVVVAASQTGAVTFKRLLGWQHEQEVVVLFPWVNWMQPQSELLGLRVGKLKAKGPLKTVQAQVELPAHSQLAGS